MANPIFAAMNGNQPNMMQMLQQLKANPAQFLMQRKFNLPQGVDTNNPQAIINHLVSSGQVSQDAYNRAFSMARQFGNR